MDLQNEKRDHSQLTHSPTSEVEGVRIVIISFRNITKNKKHFGKKIEKISAKIWESNINEILDKFWITFL